MLSVNSNVQALGAYVNLNKTQTALSASLTKLSSGLRINKAADDAAGLAISESLKAQINGLTQATSNAQDGINLAQTADGALAQVQSILQRLSVLATQASNGTQSTSSRTAINTEATQLTKEIDRIAASTSFNGISLLDGSKLGQSGLTFQVGYTTTATNGGTGGDVSGTGGTASNFQIQLGNSANATTSGFNFTASGGFKADNLLGSSKGTGLTLTTASDLPTGDTTFLSNLTTGGQSAAANIAAVNNALTIVSTARATLGAMQNRFQYAIDNNNTATVNLQAAQSQISDTDMASEMVSFTRTQILSQAGSTMLAQAKNLPSSILELLRG